MPNMARRAYAYNLTRQAFLANDLSVADSHWSRLKGLLGTSQEAFGGGKGLWIVPCHGVHTLAMRYSIDVVYLDAERKVVRLEENVKPFRFTPLCLDAETVLELPTHTICHTRTEVGDMVEIRLMARNGKNFVRAEV